MKEAGNRLTNQPTDRQTLLHPILYIYSLVLGKAPASTMGQLGSQPTLKLVQVCTELWRPRKGVRIRQTLVLPILPCFWTQSSSLSASFPPCSTTCTPAHSFLASLALPYLLGKYTTFNFILNWLLSAYDSIYVVQTGAVSFVIARKLVMLVKLIFCRPKWPIGLDCKLPESVAVINMIYCSFFSRSKLFTRWSSPLGDSVKEPSSFPPTKR